jgi:hypothetical protein
MSTPVFDEVGPQPGCVCEDCARRRLIRAASRAMPPGAPPAAAPAALVVLATAGAAVMAPAAVAAPAEDSGQAASAGRTEQAAQPDRIGAAVPLRLTRDQILERAQRWIDAGVPYDMKNRWRDGYRQDCSGFVSMAWGLGSSQWTGTLPRFAERISRDELEPGDILLFHNRRDPVEGSHVTIFGGWANAAHSRYVAYEQTRPRPRVRTTPYAYWDHSKRYVPYRYKYLSGEGYDDLYDDLYGDIGIGDLPSAGYPGSWSFGPGASNGYITRLGRMLRQRGASTYYHVGPGPRWSEADRRATRAFQRAQGWKGDQADGFPGPLTWRYLTQGAGTNIGGGRPSAPPAYPGIGSFRPGQSGPHVLALGRRLVAKGFGRFYAQGPGPRWGEADRRAVEAFQRAQGWSGREADGYPGPETWRRIFS